MKLVNQIKSKVQSLTDDQRNAIVLTGIILAWSGIRFAIVKYVDSKVNS